MWYLHNLYATDGTSEAMYRPGAMDKKHGSLNHALVYTIATFRRLLF